MKVCSWYFWAYFWRWFRKKNPNLTLKFWIQKIQKKFRKVSCAPMSSCQHGPMCRIWAHYNKVCRGYGPLLWHLPLKHLDLHSWMSSPWSVVLRSCHIIFSYFFLTNYRTLGFYRRKNFNFSSFIHFVWIFSKQGQICRHGYSFVGVESLRNFDDFVIQCLLGYPKIIVSN